MDDDATQACWHQIELETWQRFEQEQRWLVNDPAYEQWLKKLNQELNSYEICSESEH